MKGESEVLEIYKETILHIIGYVIGIKIAKVRKKERICVVDK